MRLRAIRNQAFDLAAVLGLLAVIAALIRFPAQSVAAAHDGLTLSANVIIPSLFPFFVLSTLTIELGLADRFGRLLEPVMRPLFNVGAAASAAFVLGFIGGYPIGAKSVITLYQNGDCTQAESERLLSFCNNSGPSFILGVVGAGVFSSSKIGFMIYAAHVLASVCIGILFRNWKRHDRRAQRATAHAAPRRAGFAPAFVSSVKSSFQSTLNICGFVIFFTVFIRLLYLAGIIPLLSGLLGDLLSPLGFDARWAERLFTGLIELSSGVWTLQGAAGQLGGRIAMAAFMLGWAGLSIHCQALSFIFGSGLSARTYLFGKMLHGVLSAAFVTVLTWFIPLEAPVASYLAEQVTGIATLRFSSAFAISSLCAGVLFLVILATVFISSKKARNF